LYYLFSEILLI